MANLFATGASWLASKRKQVTNILVSITRKSDITVGVSATVGQSEDELETVSGLLRFDIRNFIIAVEDYEIAAAQVEPEIGDIISEGDGTTWEVLPEAGLSPWKFHDSSKLSYRIRTKQRTL